MIPFKPPTLRKKSGGSSSFSKFDAWFQTLSSHNDVGKLRCIKERYEVLSDEVLDGENVKTRYVANKLSRNVVGNMTNQNVFRLVSDILLCESMIETYEQELANYRMVENKLADYRMIFHVVNKVLRTHQEEELHQVELVTTEPKYRIVKQKHHLNDWDNWSREEQIRNSYATDETTALSGMFDIPGYVVLRLKKEV